MSENEVPLTLDYVRQQLKTDDHWLVRSVVVIFELQTEDEKMSDTTSHLNGVGFNGLDAPFLSSLAKQALRNSANHKSRDGAIFWSDCLSPKQKASARKLMPKYSGQILKIALARAAAKPAAEPVKKAVASGPNSKGSNGYRIIWPDVRKVSIPTAWTWVQDAFANGDIDGPLDLPLDTLMEQLEQSGKITMAHRRDTE